MSSVDSTTSESQKTTDGQQTRPKEKAKVKKDRMPKVTLENVVADNDVVVCMFDTFKGVKITFKFGIHDDEPEDVAAKMVYSCCYCCFSWFLRAFFDFCLFS